MWGKKEPWTCQQVRAAINAQLDPTASARSLKKRLKLTARKIDYWQKRNVKSAYYHRRKRRSELLAAGVDLERAVRCPPWPILVELDLGHPERDLRQLDLSL